MEYPKGEPLQSRVATIRRLARWAANAIRSWELIDKNIGGNRTRDLLIRFRPYLVIASHGQRELGLLYLHSIFEKREDTVNINAVCRHLKAHDIDVSSIEIDLADHAPTLRKLYELRGSAVGHRTSARSYDATFAKVRLQNSELDALVALSDRCAFKLANLIGLPPEAPLIDPIDALDEMLRTLVDAEIARKASEEWN